MVPWNRLMKFMNLRFAPPLRSNPLGELKELRRTGSVDEYQRQFLALLCRCDELPSVHAMNLFTAGLGEPMTSDVEMQQPANLQFTMSLARAFERCANFVNQAPVSRFPSQSRQTTAGPAASAAASTAAGLHPLRLPRCVHVFIDSHSKRWLTSVRRGNAISAQRSSPWIINAPRRGFFSWS
jgi:hypothetical protein